MLASCRSPLLALPVLVGVLSASTYAGPQESTRVRIAHARAVEEGPVVDGRVDESVWQEADVITGFVQSEPTEGEPATEKTEVRILYTNSTIYFGVICYDSEPSQLVVSDTRRDANLDEMDAFFMILDTYHDQQNGFVFATNPAGLEYDGQVTNEGQGGGGGGGGRPGGGSRAQSGSGGGFNLNWDASWSVRTHVNEIGWMAEFAIPLRNLRYESATPQIWGVNFQRNIRRNRENVYWSPVSRIFNLYRLSSAGELRELELETPRNFKVTPYALGTTERDYTVSPDAELDGEWGVDSKFGISPSLNLDLTYNTDFAQVEVDEQQINFTRFNLFFPEKRPFFLENAGFFTMGRSQQVELFFSRRIGIGEDGALVPIVAGGRLSGKAGDFNVGFLNMQTERVQGLTPANNYTVASLSRDFPNRSNLGVLFVNRTATGEGAGDDNWNRTYGLNGKLGIGEMWTFNGFLAGTQTPGATGSERSFHFQGDYRRQAGWATFEYTEVGADFNPEVGFLRRDDYRNLLSSVHRNIRFPEVSWFRELRPHVSYEGFWDFDGFKETERTHIDSHVEFENGAFFSPAVNLTVEGLQEPFEVFPGIAVPPGSYRNANLAWRWNTDLSKPFSYSGGWDYGGFLSGNQNRISTTVAYRVGSKLNTSVVWNYSDIDLEEGSFQTNLGQLRASYGFTPLINIESLLQYNDSIDTWSANVRFSWLATASTGLFIVFNTNQGLGDLLVGPQARSFIVKYTHQFDVLR